MTECEHNEWEHIASDMVDTITIADTFKCVGCGKEVIEYGSFDEK